MGGKTNIGRQGTSLGVGGWEEQCTMLESGAPAYSSAGAGEGGKQSETSGTGAREGEGVKDGAWG